MVQEGLHADHRQMVKFSGKSQSNYETVKSYLDGWMQGAATAVVEKWAVEDILRGL